MSCILETDRLILRPFELNDAESLALLIGDIEIARTTLNIPHPYPDGGAMSFIESRHQKALDGDVFSFAIINKEELNLIGGIGIHPDKPHNKAEIGYWIGRPYWGKGFATEAGTRIVRFGFEELGLNRIYAAAFAINPASANVLLKLGMKYEGTLMQHIMKWGHYEDMEHYGIVQSEYFNN